MDFMPIVGLRFQPTDEELVDHYLKNKLLGNDSIVKDIIAEIDICKFEPWDLPRISLIKSDDQWFFFCPRDYKYLKSTRSNRATKCGFWKATGIDRNVKIRGTNTIIGSKKTLIFYEGRLPGVKTNWVIHEYHAVTFDESQRTFVLCHLMKKPEKKAKGGNDTLTSDEGEPSSRNMGSHYEYQARVEEMLDVVDGLPKMNAESTFEAPLQVAQCFPHSIKQFESSTNSPFLGAYFNNEINNIQTQLETIQEETESVDSFMYFRDENITFQSPFETIQQEDEFVNSFLIDLNFGIIDEEREHASVNGPTQSDSLTMLYNESTYMNVEVASALVNIYFLHCRLGELPFNFLGIPIGANPRLSVTWKPVIKKMRDRLTSWRSRQLSIGGRVTLINSVLASLPLYYLSFFKVPKMVLKEMIQIQRNFLWGGSSGVRKMAWVRWSKVCVSKESGGLGIRNMEVFNLSLLGKWKWRLKVDTSGEWAKLLNRLYGGVGILTSKQASVWWKDIQKVGSGNSPESSWFDDGVKIKVGSGSVARFWHDVWCGPSKFKDLFPGLYQLAGDKNCSVAAAGAEPNISSRWRLCWLRELTDLEQIEADLLLDVLMPITLDNEAADSWIWMHDKSKKYKVNSTYGYLISRSSDVDQDEDKRTAWKRLWKSAAPSKHLVLAWRFLVGGLPTRVELKKRGVIAQDQSCVCALCEGEEEDSMHLFLGCSVAQQLWQHVFSWCGEVLYDSSDPFDFFLQNSVAVQHKKWRRISYLPWLAVLWVIWINRNGVIFRGARIHVNSMVNHVKILVWGWYVQKVDKNTSITIERWCQGSLRDLFLDANVV